MGAIGFDSVGMTCATDFAASVRREVRMDKVFVTGAAGHVGNTVCRLLCDQGAEVVGLALPGEPVSHLPEGVRVVRGDVRDPASLAAFLADGAEGVVIHTAGIVTIASRADDRVRQVNVQGTRNMLEAAKAAHVRRFVHVSSVHAIPERPAGEIIREVDTFRPEDVHGLYAQTKSEATQAVLDAARNGLDAVVVHPSGIIGPGDWGHGHLTQLMIDFLKGHLTACVQGGYDFVDVRDVASGILGAAVSLPAGQCCILSGHYSTIPDLLNTMSRVTGHKPVRTVLPLWFARLTAPLAEGWYHMLRQPPLYTAYSLYTLETNAAFSHQRATALFGYAPRPLEDTLRDTAAWLREAGRV